MGLTFFTESLSIWSNLSDCALDLNYSALEDEFVDNSVLAADEEVCILPSISPFPTRTRTFPNSFLFLSIS